MICDRGAGGSMHMFQCAPTHKAFSLDANQREVVIQMFVIPKPKGSKFTGFVIDRHKKLPYSTSTQQDERIHPFPRSTLPYAGECWTIATASKKRQCASSRVDQCQNGPKAF